MPCRKQGSAPTCAKALAHRCPAPLPCHAMQPELPGLAWNSRLVSRSMSAPSNESAREPALKDASPPLPSAPDGAAKRSWPP